MREGAKKVGVIVDLARAITADDRNAVYLLATAVVAVAGLAKQPQLLDEAIANIAAQRKLLGDLGLM